MIKALSKDYQDAKSDSSVTHLIVVIKHSDHTGLEVIINPRENFEEKVSYYLKAYDDNLVLKSNYQIRMVSHHFVRDNDFSILRSIL